MSLSLKDLSQLSGFLGDPQILAFYLSNSGEVDEFSCNFPEKIFHVNAEMTSIDTNFAKIIRKYSWQN